MTRRVNVPPIKSQGIKTKLVPWIKSVVPDNFRGTWIEPFMGTGVVGFNLAPERAIFCDTNPHLVHFYESIARGHLTPEVTKEYLEREGEQLLANGEHHYYAIRERFNAEHSSLDFLFLNRAGFNGMMRFNRKGKFNIPFCRKPARFAQAYITKIVNQVDFVAKLTKHKRFTFKCQDFSKTITEASASDIVYCDPPYIDRHVDYFNGWDESCERALQTALSEFHGKFILSTWHHNDFRENQFVKSLWSRYTVLTRDHFYHVGAKEENRNPVVEALVTNISIKTPEYKQTQPTQYALLESRERYDTN